MVESVKADEAGGKSHPGASQGCVLSPLSFSIYTNNLSSADQSVEPLELLNILPTAVTARFGSATEQGKNNKDNHCCHPALYLRPSPGNISEEPSHPGYNLFQLLRSGGR